VKTWLLNPRSVTRTRPANNPANATFAVVEIDCPCGCATPFVLPPIANVTFPAPGATLTQLQWRQLLNNYTIAGRVHRVRNTLSNPCGWAGRIVAGRIFSRDDNGEDDQPFGVRVAETLTYLRQRGDINGG
jgi:hypothetical protein